MPRPFLFPVSLIACAVVLAGAMVAPAAGRSSSAEVQRLENLRALLAQEKTGKTGNESLTSYFTRVAAKFRAAGYPQIAQLLQKAAARAIVALDRQEKGPSLNLARHLSQQLAQAISQSSSLPATDNQGGSGTTTLPDYLHLASIFADNLSKATKNVITDRPVTRGIAEQSKPLTLTFTQMSDTGAEDHSPSTGGVVTYSSGGLTKSGTGTLTLSGATLTVTNGGAGTGTVTLVTSSGTVDLGNVILAPSPTPAESSSNLGIPTLITDTVTLGQFTTVSTSFDTTVGPTADLIIPAGSSLAIAAGHAFALLGTLNVDLAKSVQVILSSPTGVLQGVTDVATTQTPVIGTSTSTFHLEAGATLNVKNPAPGTYTILSGFQTTGNTLGDVTITGLTAGQSASLSESDGTVTLTITGTDLSLSIPDTTSSTSSAR